MEAIMTQHESPNFSVQRLPRLPVTMPKFETSTSATRNRRATHANMTLGDKIQAAAMDQTRILLENEKKKYIKFGVESSVKAATFNAKNQK